MEHFNIAIDGPAGAGKMYHRKAGCKTPGFCIR